MDTDSVGFTPRDEESEVAAGQRRKFTPEFRNEAVRLVLDTSTGLAEVFPSNAQPVRQLTQQQGEALARFHP